MSAFKKGVRRPGYERLLEEVGEGEAVVVYKLDRMARTVREFVRFTEHLEERRAVFVSVHDPVDTSTPIGRAVLGVLAVFAQLESEQTRLRVQGAHAELAERGMVHGGGRRPFGHERTGEVREDEAELVREAARRFLDGESLWSIAIDWNGRGVLTPGTKKEQGGKWSSSVLGGVLRSPRLAGYRVHHGALHPSDVIEAVIDEDLHLRLAEALNDSRRRANRRTVARYLLTTIMRCALCGGPMHSKLDTSNGKLRYVCGKRPDAEWCGSVTIDLEQTEAFVRDMVLEAIDAGALIDTDQARDTERVRGESEVSLADDQAALEGLSRDFYVDRTISRVEFTAARAPLVERIGQSEALLARLGQHGPAPDLPTSAEGLRAWWDDAEIPDRRRLVGLVLDRIDVKPVRQRGYNRFDRERIVPHWKV